MKFDELNLIAPIVKALRQQGYVAPTPIQEQAIPAILAHSDVLGCAQTGTGKTAAFALPILQLFAKQPVHKGPRSIRALVLTPTRELALQVYESFTSYGRYLPLRCSVIFGGVSQKPQEAALRRGVDILVATPGRLNDLMGQGLLSLKGLEIFVLDEADRMLDMGFIHDVKRVIAQLPVRRQNLLFSATMPEEIVAIARQVLVRPVTIAVSPVSSVVEAIEQGVYLIERADKRHLLKELLHHCGASSVLVFTRTKHGADRVARDLSRSGLSAAAIHGDKSQGARQAALKGFKAGRIRTLVATDIAARGIDISELAYVINYDLPNISETYIHRIGRTGRAGHAGVAISFCQEDERPYLQDIQKLIGRSIPVLHSQWDSPIPLAEPACASSKKNAPHRSGRPKRKEPSSHGAPLPAQAQAVVREKQPAGLSSRPPKPVLPQRRPRRTGPRNNNVIAGQRIVTRKQ